MLAASAAITPTIAISNIPSGPNALAFDASGDLWVGAGGNVLKYAAARLTASTSDPADLSIESKSPPPVISTLPNALGLAFDASANLWVDYDGTLAKITPAEQSATGTSSITPGVQITADVTALPEGLAFDEGGGLWMAYSVGKFAKFGAAQLGASGTLAPEVVISGNDVASATMPALYPAPAALPLFSALP
jgi:sugar lactone lactonase YvrE